VTAEVVIVGAGPAGLSTAGALKRRGTNAVVLDKSSAVGESWSRRYDRLHLHTIRPFSGLAYFPIPGSYPKYLSRDEYAEYLRTYAKRLGIDVSHGCTVTKIRVDASSRVGYDPSYVVESSAGVWRTPTVVVATGMFGEPIVPSISGIERYLGRTMHSSAYTSGRDFAGKRVLIVGLGNTAAEIVVDLVEQGAAAVSVSIRATPPIVPRDFLLTPVQLFGIALWRVSPAISDRVASIVSRVAFGDLTRYGMRRPDWLPFSAKRIPVIDVGFVRELKAGRIAVRPVIEHFYEDGVVFADGKREAYDIVLFATGYKTGLKTILEVPDLLDDEGYSKFASGEVTTWPGMYFMGFIESHRGLLFEIEAASRYLARNIARRTFART
jgi:cation diffusion facilitator CzcD-associated flavoprotein CzcO